MNHLFVLRRIMQRFEITADSVNEFDWNLVVESIGQSPLD